MIASGCGDRNRMKKRNSMTKKLLKGYPMKYNAMAIDVRTRIIYSVLTIATIMFSMGRELMAQTNTSTVVKNIVLVHGGFVDGSGWEGVYKALKKDGYTVAIVQHPTISLPDDVAVTNRAIASRM